MPIKAPCKIYSLTIPGEKSVNSLMFFSSSNEQTLYFKSREEAEVYKDTYHPHLSLNNGFLIAAEDRDGQGKLHWVLIDKVEDMRNSNHNKSQDQSNYYRHSMYYSATPSLEEMIHRNSSSIFTVTESKRENYESDGQMGGPSSTTVFYDITDTIDKDTRFLYVSGHERWFVQSGREISITDASSLTLEQEIKATSMKLQLLLAKKEQSEQEQRQLKNHPPSG